MRVFLSLLLCVSLVFSQTVIVPIPGERPAPPPENQTSSGGGGVSALGAVLGVLVGGLILSLIFSKALSAKPPEQKAKERELLPAFVPFEFIVVYRGLIPPGLDVLESVSFEDLNFSLVHWEKSQRELEESLKDKALFVQPNYLYSLFGGQDNKDLFVAQSPSPSPKGTLCLLDTGANKELVEQFLIGTEDHLRSPYKPEDHGTANVHLAGSGGARVYLHRVCAEGRCTTFAFVKALISCFKKEIKVIAAPFGMYGEDRLASLVISSISRFGFRVVAPVGNESTRELPFPARHPQVIKVAGDPCFPSGICEPYPKEPYRVISIGADGRRKLFIGTSFSSVLHALRLALEYGKSNHLKH